MLFLIWLVLPTVYGQNLYGPSQLDQYARLINSGNLNGFGWLNQAIQKGTIRGFGDLDEKPKLQGLPPLPLTHEEVLHQLTSTSPQPTTQATARPTQATPTPLPQADIYGINPVPEMPPRPEERIRGTYDDDGVFHPSPDSDEDDIHPRRSQIRGTKIRDFSEKSQKRAASPPTSFGEDYESDDFYDDPHLRVPSNNHHEGSNVKKTFQVDQSAHTRQTNNRVFPKEQHPRIVPPRIHPSAPTSSSPSGNHPPPPFVFHPHASPTQDREPLLNNLLSEVEEYDDFLDQQRAYREKYPHSHVVNPYRMLPEGQLPTISSRTNFLNVPPRQAFQNPRPAERIVAQPTQQSHFNQFNNNFAPPPQQQQQQQQQHQQAFHYPRESTEHPLLSIFNLFSLPHAHALAAPSLHASSASSADIPEKKPNTIEGTTIERGTLLPSSGLVDIHQRPLNLPTGVFPTFG
ncbi:unnamed protein product [Auanema sp. JU1783]|nr:unnamed protein product [Auanema sp. JU1783]